MSPTRLLPLLHLGFLASGIGACVLGPLVPCLTQLGLDPEQIGRLFLIQFVASSIGAVSSTHSPSWTIGGGYLALGGGLLAFATGARVGAVPAVILVGLGLGASIPATNLAVAANAPDRRAAALAQLNLLWGLGALASPLVVAAALTRAGLSTTIGTLGAASVALGAILLAPQQRAQLAAVCAPAGLPATTPPAAVLIPHALRLFLTIGAEATVGGWLVALSVARQIPTLGALGIGSLFWASFVLARTVVPAVLPWCGERRLLQGALALAGLGALAIVLRPETAAVVAAAVLLGLGLGPCFPLVVAALSRVSATTGGWVFALGGCGAGLLPWFAGAVASRTSLALAFLVPLGAVLALAAVSWRPRPDRVD